jgi:hypothetical protein
MMTTGANNDGRVNPDDLVEFNPALDPEYFQDFSVIFMQIFKTDRARLDSGGTHISPDEAFALLGTHEVPKAAIDQAKCIGLDLEGILGLAPADGPRPPMGDAADNVLDAD